MQNPPAWTVVFYYVLTFQPNKIEERWSRVLARGYLLPTACALASSHMKGTISHVGINLSNSEESFDLWRDFLRFLSFVIADDGNHFDAHDGHSYLCVSTTKGGHRQVGYHRKQTGLGHLAFNVPSAGHVDQFVTDFLRPRGIEPLYGGAKAYPQYAEGYYAVYFEDLDRVKIEVVYEPSHQSSPMPPVKASI